MTRSDPGPDHQRLDLSAWSAPEPPAGLTDAVMSAVGTARPGAPAVEPAARGWRRPGLAVAALAAGAATAAAVTWWLWPEAAGERGGHVSAAAPSSLRLAEATDALVEAGGQLDWHTSDDAIAVEQRRGAVTYRHHGRALTITTPLGTVTSRRATFRVSITPREEEMNNKVVLAGAGAAAAVAAVAIVVYDGKAEVRDDGGTSRTIAAGSSTTLVAPEPAPPPLPVAVTRTVKDRARRDAVAAAIARVRAARDAATGAAHPATGSSGGRLPTAPSAAGGATDDTPGVLTKDEIRTGVREVVPMLADCYTLELVRDPTLGGTVVAHLVVDAEPDLGTVVTLTDVELPPAFQVTPDFRDCMTATLEAVVLPPLAEGGRVEITYPLSFSNTDDEESPPAPSSTRRTTGGGTAAAAAADPAALIDAAETAAKASRWRLALELSQRVLAMHPDAGVEMRAVSAGVLAACNLRDQASARPLFARLPANRKVVIQQRCDQMGVDLTPGR